VTKRKGPGGQLPQGLPKTLDTSADIERWLRGRDRAQASQKPFLQEPEAGLLLERAFSEIAALRLREMRYRLKGEIEIPSTHGHDPVSVLRHQSAYMKGDEKEPIPHAALQQGIDRAVEEILRHRSLL